MKVEQLEKVTYQGVAWWMIPVAVLVTLAFCAGFAQIWKVVQINRDEKQRKKDAIKAIAEGVVQQKVDTIAEEISTKVSEAMEKRFAAIDKKLDTDKVRIEAAEKRSGEHDKALERIEQTLESVDTNIKDMREGFTHLARGTIATLNHQQHNGNAEELEEAARELNKYLTQRPIVPMNDKGGNSK
jgi:archaellum component FlaC